MTLWSTSNGTPHTRLRYRWSHRHPVHRAVVRAANSVLPRVPFEVKYTITDLLRRGQFPYRLLHAESIAIQVGAPSDTLRAGRSRAMGFARKIGPHGRLLVVEPDSRSVEEFRQRTERHSLFHVSVVCAAAWSEETNLTLEVDPAHPATNFTDGAAEYSEAERRRFTEADVRAVRLDDLVEEADLGPVDVVSITTNGAEAEILRGLQRTLERHRPYISLARTRSGYSQLMADLGYELLADDDRGFTFRPKSGGHGG